MAAFDCLTDWFRGNGLYSRYEKELEALCVKHVLLTASVRVAKTDPASPVLRELSDYVQRHFPAWSRNPYVQAYSAKHKLILRLLQWRQYRTLQRLMMLNDRRKAGGIERLERNAKK